MIFDDAETNPMLRRLHSTVRLKMPPMQGSVVSGSCACGNVAFEARFAKSPREITTRTCDCDYCVARNAKYASDPLGDLKFIIKKQNGYQFSKQEPESNAKFLSCLDCADLVGVIFRPEDSNKLIGTLNASLVIGQPFGGTAIVSPKKLNPQEKIQRWKENWFGNVKVEVEGQDWVDH